jgi:hypothetical protein
VTLRRAVRYVYDSTLRGFTVRGVCKIGNNITLEERGILCHLLDATRQIVYRLLGECQHYELLQTTGEIS